MSDIIGWLILFNFSLCLNYRAWCIWPPPYNVDLKQEEIFVIDESLEKAEIQEVYDEEIVNDNDRKQLGLDVDQGKFYRLHNAFKPAKDNIYKTEFAKNIQIFEESYPEKEEPSNAGFLGRNQEGSLEVVLHKREGDYKSETDVTYDYKDLKDEFDKNLKEEKKSNESLTYIETTEESVPKGFLKKLILSDENTTINCSKSRNFGFNTLECLVEDLGKPKMRSKALERFIRIFLVMTFVYLVIVIPLWCQYGWCCCCCRCKFCRPMEEIEDVRKFFIRNPLGIYHDREGKKHDYKPTVYEKYAHRQLDKALQSL